MRYGGGPTADMPSDRTFVTELATGLGMVGAEDLAAVIAQRPRVLVNLTEGDWERLAGLWRSGSYESDFVAGFLNGRAFLAAEDALNSRRPRIIEWTGGRRPPGDEVVPSDLRVDHVYLISCKQTRVAIAPTTIIPPRSERQRCPRAPGHRVIGYFRKGYQRLDSDGCATLSGKAH